MTDLEWKNPPAPKRTRADEVAAQLRSKPGEWALIHHAETLEFLPWYTRLYNDTEYEMRFVRPPGTLFAPVDVYARFKNEEK